MSYELSVSHDKDGSVEIRLTREVAAFFGNKEIMLCIGPGHTLRLYREDAWLRWLEKLRELSEKQIKMFRPLITSMEVITASENGVIPIGPRLAAYAGMTGNKVRLTVDWVNATAELTAI